MTLVWLPSGVVTERAIELLDGVPASWDVERWDGRSAWPPGVGDVEAFVVPYMVGDSAVAPVPSMTRLRLLQTLTAGYENVIGLARPGLTICNARGVHDDSTAELALTLALAAQRGVPDFVRAAEQRRWAAAQYRSLADRRVLIIGYGGIGSAIERRLAGFQVEVVRVASTARQAAAGPVHGIDELPDLLPAAEVVFLSLPLSERTAGLVDARFLQLLPDGALLVNVARGGIVDTGALLAELESGRLRAALDVTDPEPLPADHPLWAAPNLLLSPHVGGNTAAFEPRAARFLAAQLRRFADGEPLVSVVSPG